jgi:hypothetical protein
MINKPNVVNVQKKIISVPAAAQESCTSRDTIMAWGRSGELPIMNLARDRNGRPRYGIFLSDLEEFLRGRRVIPSDANGTTRRLRRRANQNIKQFF